MSIVKLTALALATAAFLVSAEDYKTKPAPKEDVLTVGVIGGMDLILFCFLDKSR
jgi:hypothetical protein